MTITEYISSEKIKERICQMGAEISGDYAGKEIVVVGILNGAFMFCADLVREIKSPVRLDFMLTSSYGDGTVSSGNIKIKLDMKKSVQNKHVLIVEDIVDTGMTISCLLEMMKARNPASIKLASLLYKPARAKYKIDIDYLGFEIEDKFVIGYGLDLAGRFRELPYIGIYHEDQSS